MVKTPWYELPIKVNRNGTDMIIPANQVEDGDLVFFDGEKRQCDGMIPDDDEEIIYLIFGIDQWPSAIFDAK